MPKTEQMITWIVPVEQANVILSIIAKQPYEMVAPLIDDLQTQARSQLPQQPNMPHQAMPGSNGKGPVLDGEAVAA